MKKKVLILVNHNVVIYNFRKELVQRLVSDGYEVYLSCPQGNRIEELKRMECKYIETDVERRSLNPFTDLSLLRHYKKIMREIKPDVVLTYTIKPNIYGGMAARKYNIPQLANITGLGTSIEDGGISSKFILQLYKYGIKSARTVFFQNQTNLDFFKRQGLVRDNYALIPGSGVNLTENYFEPYPEETNKTVLLIIGRMMKNKGTGEILEAAEEIRKRRKDVIFRFIGFPDDDWKAIIDEAVKKGIVEYLGNQTDVHSFIKNSQATLMASYHEGMSNVLLEAAASGRPLIVADRSGCREVVDDNVTGFIVPINDEAATIEAVYKFLALTPEEREQMGIEGRKKMEKEFDRQLVVEAYVEEVYR